ncbi:MAG: hypothetical protein ACAI43_25480 [Phycisphaerae bacterium]
MVQTTPLSVQVPALQFRAASRFGQADGFSSDLPATPPVIDTRLVAAVQRGAGARCHEAAGLLQDYYLCVDNCAQDTVSPETGGAVTASSWKMLMTAKARLRAFLVRQ